MAYLIVTREFPPQDGGISIAAWEMAKNFAAAGKKVYVLTWEAPPNVPKHFKDEAEPFGITRLKMPERRLGQILALFFAVARLVRKYHVERIYATTWNFSGLVSALHSLIRPVPFVVFSYGNDASWEMLSAGDRMLMRFTLGRAKIIFASSHFLKDLLLKADPHLKTIVYMPPGVDADVFHPRKRDDSLRKRLGIHGKKLLITVSRLVDWKGHDRVLRALPEVLEQYSDFFYLIVGDGPEMENLKRRVKELGLESYVGFTGFIPNKDLPPYYAAADIYVNPSGDTADAGLSRGHDFEGFGIVFLEASASAIPVIAGRSGGAADAVADGESGILVDPKSQTEIMQAILRLLADDTFAKKMGEAGRKRVEREFHWPVLIRRYEKAFESF